MTRNAVPWCSPTSYSVQMWGCVELRNRTGFVIEPRTELGISGKRVRQNLDRDRTVESCVPRLIYLAHATRTE